MAKSKWVYLQGEKRVGEYELLTVRSIGHWWLGHDEKWSEAFRRGYHLYSETGVGMVEPTRLHINDAYAYRDVHKLTYRSYVIQQDNEEKKLDGLIEGVKQRHGFRKRPELQTITECYIPAIRHCFWGFGMLETYGAAYTLSGTVMNALTFQAFDCMRHAQRFVELTWEINHSNGVEVDGKQAWIEWFPIQPLRRFVEMALTNFDWAENLVLLNFVLHPLFQPLHTVLMVDIPEQQGDWAIGQFWLRLAEDTQRHLVCGRDFVKAALKDDPRNRPIVQDWLDKWFPLALAAVDGLKPVVDEANAYGFAKTHADIRAETLANFAREIAGYGLVCPPLPGVAHDELVRIPA